MTFSLAELEHRRSELQSRLAGTGGRCGNLRCHCHQANDLGHGPYYRLTRKVEGKTVTETFSTDAHCVKHSARWRNTTVFGH